SAASDAVALGPLAAIATCSAPRRTMACAIRTLSATALGPALAPAALGTKAGALRTLGATALGPALGPAALGTKAGALGTLEVTALGPAALGTKAGALGTLGATALCTTAWAAKGRLAELLLKVRVLVRHTGMMRRIVLPRLELGAAGIRNLSEFAVQRRINHDAAAIPMIAAPYCRPDVECRPPAPDRAGRPPDRMPEERWRYVDGRPIAYAEDHDRIVDRDVIDLGLDRLDVVDDLRRRPRVTGRRRLL